jgi:phosphoribosyl 1,2-cyclic phosphate phosphodiesterase
VLERSTKFQDVEIIPLPVNHGNITVMGFRLNDLSYLTDVKAIPESTKDLIRGSKVLVLSGLRWEPEHPTHLTIPEAAELAEELEVPETYLIHMNSYVNHAESNRRLPDHVKLAYDQLVVEIP